MQTETGCIYISPHRVFATFRYDYRLKGRRESIVLGKYGRGGISLLTAREMCIEVRRSVAAGNSPAQDKQRAKRMLKEAKSFGQFGARWLNDAQMADSTRAMRKSVFTRDILPAFDKRLLSEIKPDDFRHLPSYMASGSKIQWMRWISKLPFGVFQRNV